MTVVSFVKFAPVIVARSPPMLFPLLGVTEEIAGGATPVYAESSVAVPPGVVTVTPTMPVMAGAVTTTSVELT
jgi:hypothetical protein